MLKPAARKTVSDRHYKGRFSQLSATILVGWCMSAIGILHAADEAEKQPVKSEQSSPEKQKALEATPIPWSKANTKIANHYIQILQQTPEYNRVLELLWDLYRHHEQTALLLSYFEKAAEQQDALVAKILYGHLLRKTKNLSLALKFYEQALAIDPDEIHALRGAAEILDQEEKSAKSLTYYDRLVKLLPANHKDNLAIQLHRADLLKTANRVDEAAEAWNRLLTEHPRDKVLRTRMVALLLEAGLTDEAVKVLKLQEQSTDPEEKLAALETLSGLYGFIDDFDGAVDAAEKAKALLHFKNYRYKQFFKVQGRLYERFGRLKELEEKLHNTITGKGSSEKSLRDLAEYFRLIAKPKKEQPWVKRLTEIAPNNSTYSLRLAELLIENEEFQLAAKQLDKLIREQDPPHVQLIFMRSLVTLNTDGKKAAETILKQYLVDEIDDSTSPETLNRVLAFARYHYLDQVVEDLLRGPLADRIMGGDGKGNIAILELARFFRERGRTQKAKETIAAYINQDEKSPKAKSRRYTEAAKVYAELKMYVEAEKTLEKALAVEPENRESRLILATVQAERGAIDKAVSTYNQVWQRTPELAEQTEIGRRLFSLLRALVDKADQASPGTQPAQLRGPPQTLEDFRRLARAATQNTRRSGADEPLPERLSQFYDQIKRDAQQHPDLAHKYRVAWWGFKLQDYREMYHQLADLHQPDNPVVEVEKLMLELAELTGNTLLAGRKLKLLSEIDKENESEYLRRWAEFRFKMEYQDQAVRLMEELARRNDATLSTLKSLVGFYKRQGRKDDQIAVWRSAYERAGIDEKRQIAKQLTTTLLEMGKVEEALDVQLDLIEEEPDSIQKRRLFESQLTLATRTRKLPWLKKRYTGLVAQAPFEHFYPEALGKIHRASGDPKAAYQVLKKAYYMSNHDQTLLAQLGELADQSNDLKAAIYYRRQLIVSDENKANIESWKLLINMLEKDLRVSEADLTRKRFEGKFARDVDFLRETANYYLKTNRPHEAQRNYEKLVNLRPWDAALWLELGLLQKENGHHTDALASFQKAIDTTTEDALPVDKVGQALTYLPVIAGGWRSSAELRPDTGGLEALIEGIQEYRFLESEQQDVLVSWLRAPHPEFQRVPSPRTAVRLRAIEEAARLSSDNPETLEKWLARWKAGPSTAGGERLWAIFYAGEFDQAQTILDELMLPLTHHQNRFFYALLSLRMGHADTLFKQPKLAVEQQGGSFSVLAALLLLQEDPESISRETLEAVFLQSPVTIPIARHLQNSLQLDGKLLAAYKAGESLARTQSSVDADFMYQIARSAEWLGWRKKRLYWLERSLELIEPNPIRGLPVSFYGVASELHGLRESAEEKAAALDYLEQKVERHPAVTQGAILESRLSLAMIAGDRDKVLSSLRTLTKNQVEAGRPRRDRSTRRGYAQVEHWSGMERLLNEHFRRLSKEVSAEDFYDAMSSVDQVAPQDAAVMAQYQQFSMARLMWLLAAKGAPERRHLVAELFTHLNDETLRLELARTLESRSFYRESIPVYLNLIEADPDDFTLVRGFFAACRKARDYQPALELIGRFLNREAVRSKGMTDLYLVQNHAYFLGLARDVKALRSYGARLPEPFFDNVLAGTGSETADLTNEYYRVLLNLYRERNQSDEELGILFRLKARKGLTRADQLEGGRILLDQHNPEEARVWLEAIELIQSQPSVEIETIRLLADIYATPGELEKEKFAELTRQALKYDDNDLILHVAERLREAKLNTMADSALLLRIRSSKSGREKPALLLALIKGRLNKGEKIEQLGPEMQALLTALAPSSTMVTDWFEFVRSELKSDPGGFRKALPATESSLKGPGSSVLRQLTHNLIARAQLKEETPVMGGLDPGSMTEAELLCVLEQLAESRREKNADQLLSSYAAANERPLGFEYPARMIRALGKLGDATRIAELHTGLMVEPISETFRRRVRIEAIPGIDKRWPLPGVFADAGYPDLAGSLYRTYLDAVQKDGRVPGDFLVSYAEFLTTNGDYPTAENLLVQLFRRSSGDDDETIVEEVKVLINLYQVWNASDQGNSGKISERLQRYHLTSGLRIRIIEVREALLEAEKSSQH